MDHFFKVFYSNQLEILSERLKKDLFYKSSPFAKRIILVPTPFMKSWLLWQMANDPNLGIACGVKIYTLNQGIPRLASLLDPHSETSFQTLLSPLEISLTLEMEIKKIIKNFSQESDKEQKIWKPLLTYLNVTKENLSKKSEKRLISLCSSLAEFFHQYGIYGGKMIQEWFKNDTNEWQQELWVRIFNKKGNSYLHQLVDNWQKKKLILQNPEECRVHLFGLSFLCEQHYHFFLHALNVVPVSFYLLSPSLEFWSDLCTDRESQRLEKNYHSLDNTYLREGNTLISNLGKLGRSLVRKLEDSSAQIDSFYELPSSIENYQAYSSDHENLILKKTQKPLTLLQAVQADLITLRDTRTTEPITLEETDISIELHKTPSRMREVEVLYHNLLRLIDHHQGTDDPLYPSDILIMAPDIMSYESAIKAIFGSAESKLDFRLYDLRMQVQSSLVQAFLHLIKLATSRWDEESILTFFKFEEVQRKFQISALEIKEWRKWMNEASILWGNNSEHRSEVITTSYNKKDLADKGKTGTWEHGFERMLLNMAMVIPEEQMHQDDLISNIEDLPCNGIDSTQSQQLGKWIQLIRTLRKDLKPIIQNESLSFSEWSTYLCELCDHYFSPDFDDKTSSEEYDNFKKQLIQMNDREWLSQQTFSWLSIENYLHSKINLHRVNYREHHVQAVRFCSLLPMRAIPSRVIALIGMDEESFPSHAQANSLNLMVGHSKADYCPTPTEYDQYLFLETLLSVREHLIISYSLNEGGNALPSLLVSELLNYLDRSYLLGAQKPSEKCVVIHPFSSFDPRYFDSQNKKLCSYSSAYFELAEILNSKKEISHKQFHDFLMQVPRYSLKKETNFIEIKQLSQLAKNPLEIYFNNNLGIYLKDERNHKTKDREFTLDALETYKLKKEGLDFPIENILKVADKQGKLPKGLFKSVVTQQITEDTHHWKQNLESFGVCTKDLFSIEFSSLCESRRQMDDNLWMHPAVNISGTQITGMIHNITPEGLLVFGEGRSDDLYKVWPSFLILHHLKNNGFPIKPQILWLKSGKVDQIPFKNSEKSLEAYLEYYFYCLENISLLIPEWVDSVLKMEFEPFKRKMSQTYSRSWPPFYNEYMFRALSLQQIETMTPDAFAGWKNMARRVFREFTTENTESTERIERI